MHLADERRRLFGKETHPPHAGVDFDVHRHRPAGGAGAGGEEGQRLGPVQGERNAGGNRLIDFVTGRHAQHENRRRDAAVTQRARFPVARHA